MCQHARQLLLLQRASFTFSSELTLTSAWTAPAEDLIFLFFKALILRPSQQTPSLLLPRLTFLDLLTCLSSSRPLLFPSTEFLLSPACLLPTEHVLWGVTSLPPPPRVPQSAFIRSAEVGTGGAHTPQRHCLCSLKRLKGLEPGSWARRPLGWGMHVQWARRCTESSSPLFRDLATAR